MSTAKHHQLHLEPLSFRTKKWTLITMMVVDILLLILYIVFHNFLAEKAIQIRHMNAGGDHSISDEQYDYIKKTTVTIIITSSAIGIPLQLLFLYGIYRQSICLTYAYTVISVFATMIAIIQALSQPFFWITAVWAAVITIMATLYLRELHRIRRKLVGSEDGGMMEVV